MRLISYLLRWQLSTPVLCFCVAEMLNFGCNVLEATIVANLVGGLLFFKVDEVIFMNLKTVKRVAFKYILNNAMAVDCLCNALAGGDPQEFVSSRLGKLQKKYNGKLPMWRVLSKFLIWGLDKIDKDHCLEAVQPEEGADALLDREEKWNGVERRQVSR